MSSCNWKQYNYIPTHLVVSIQYYGVLSTVYWKAKQNLRAGTVVHYNSKKTHHIIGIYVMLINFWLVSISITLYRGRKVKVKNIVSNLPLNGYFAKAIHEKVRTYLSLNLMKIMWLTDRKLYSQPSLGLIDHRIHRRLWKEVNTRRAESRTLFKSAWIGLSTKTTSKPHINAYSVPT